MQPVVKAVNSSITLKNNLDHFLARIGFSRMGHTVKPGLYSLGSPMSDSLVFVTANYTLSFDALRSSLKGINCYILVLDTKGINVWCAAGKGTFGTDELVYRIKEVNLDKIVEHRELILPQLGAPGVAAHEVKKRSGFKVKYGPIRAEDVPEYLKTQKVTPEMRQVKFNLIDRLVLIPVELNLPFLVILAILFIFSFRNGFFVLSPIFTTLLVGIILFPIVLPWLPTKDFSTKGFILGLITAVPFALSTFLSHQGSPLWIQAAYSLTYIFLIPPIVSYLALNFTGSTPFTSRSGVRTEIFKYIPYLVGIFVMGIILDIILFIITSGGVI